MLQTEYAFTLPFGFVDEHGNVHRDGVMRLAIARDEIEPIADNRVRANQAYLPVLMLSRVITRIGGITSVNPELIERLFSPDFVFLQDLYIRINDIDGHLVETSCPDCGRRFSLDIRETEDG